MRDIVIFRNAAEDDVGVSERLHQDVGRPEGTLEDVDGRVFGRCGGEGGLLSVQFGGGADVEV